MKKSKDLKIGQADAHVFKIILIGSAEAGKTCMITQFVHNELPENSQPTIGVEFATKMVKLGNGHTVKAQIWDTAGQERYKTICGAHYKKSVGALVVYDITNRGSFEDLQTTWIENLMQRADPNIQVVLVGNKSDLVKEDPSLRQVEVDEAKQLAEENGFLFLETSALENENINLAFEQLLGAVAEQQPNFTKNNQQKSCLKLTDPDINKRKKGCCG